MVRYDVITEVVSNLVGILMSYILIIYCLTCQDTGVFSAIAYIPGICRHESVLTPY